MGFLSGTLRIVRTPPRPRVCDAVMFHQYWLRSISERESSGETTIAAGYDHRSHP